MPEPVTKERAQADWDECESGSEEYGGMSLLVVFVLIEIREELTALREQMRPVDTRMPR